MELFFWILLASLFTIFSFGYILILRIVIIVIFFLIGVHLKIQNFTTNIKKTSCSFSTASHTIVTDASLKREKNDFDRSICENSELNNALNGVIDKIIDNYVLHWYENLTNDKQFPNSISKFLIGLFGKVCSQVKNADWALFTTDILPNIVASHLRLYRKTSEFKDTTDENFYKVFFDNEYNFEKNLCREHIIMSHDGERRYLENLSNILLFFFLPEDDFNLSYVRYLLRDILVYSVFLPLLDCVSDADFINRTIISSIGEDLPACEYFIQSIKMSDNIDELEAVHEKINRFHNKLRGKDTGEDDVLVKAQLASLDFLIKQISDQINLNHSGKNALANENSYKNMSLEDIENNHLALSRFLDFLSSQDQQTALTLYLHCKKFKNMANIHVNDQNSVTVNKEEDISFLDEKNTEAKNVRELGVTICNALLASFPDSTEDHAQVALKTLTSQPGPPNPETFSKVEDHLKEIINGDKYLPAFKRSIYFRKMISEINRNPDANEDSISLRSDSANSSDISNAEEVFSACYSPIEMDPSSDPFYSSTKYDPLKELDNGENSDEIYSAYIKSSNFINNSYVMYTIEVSALCTSTNRNRIWETKRRFSQFDELHSIINEQCGKVVNLKLPSKANLRVSTKEFLDSRKTDLNEYLRIICLPDNHKRHPRLKMIIVDFLKESPWESKKSSIKPTNFVNPLKNVGNAVLSMPDTLIDGFSKMLNTKKQQDFNQIPIPAVQVKLGDDIDFAQQKSPELMSTNKLFHVTQKKINSCEDTDDNFHIRTFFMLLDELFDLQHKSLSMRRSVLSLLQHLARAIFGNKVHNMVVQRVHSLLNVTQVSFYINTLSQKIWPNKNKDETDGQEKFHNLRDEKTKSRTRVMSRTIMLSLLSEDLSQFLGNETTNRGIQRAFNMLQDSKLNRRLAHCLLEAIVRFLLRSEFVKIDIFFSDELKASLSGRQPS